MAAHVLTSAPETFVPKDVFPKDMVKYIVH